MFIGNTNQEEEFKDEWREKSILEDYWKAEKFLGDFYRSLVDPCRSTESLGIDPGDMAIQGIASFIRGFERRKFPLGAQNKYGNGEIYKSFIL